MFVKYVNLNPENVCTVCNLNPENVCKVCKPKPGEGLYEEPCTYKRI